MLIPGGGPVRWLLRLVAAVIVLGVAAFVVTTVRVWQVGEQDHTPHSDAILVLGAAQYNGRPSEILRDRLDHALALFRAGVAPRIVTVGGNKVGDLYTEAGTGATYLEANGVPAADVVAVPQGSDTLLSLRAAHAVFVSRRWTSVVLVTDRWHSLRSRRMARDLGMHAQTSPVTIGPTNRGTWNRLHYIAREAAGYDYYVVFRRP